MRRRPGGGAAGRRALDTVISGLYPLNAYPDLLLGQTSGIKNVLSFGAASQA